MILTLTVFFLHLAASRSLALQRGCAPAFVLLWLQLWQCSWANQSTATCPKSLLLNYTLQKMVSQTSLLSGWSQCTRTDFILCPLCRYHLQCWKSWVYIAIQQAGTVSFLAYILHSFSTPTSSLESPLPPPCIYVYGHKMLHVSLYFLRYIPFLSLYYKF